MTLILTWSFSVIHSLDRIANGGGRWPGRWFNMASYQYRKSHCGDKTVVRSSYLHNRISYTGKIPSLYWIRALMSCVMQIKHTSFLVQIVHGNPWDVIDGQLLFYSMMISMGTIFLNKIGLHAVIDILPKINAQIKCPGMRTSCRIHLLSVN